MDRRIRRIAAGILLVIFLGSTGVILYTKHQYRVSEDLYSQASDRYTVRMEEPEVQDGEALAPVVVDLDRKSVV